MSREFFDFADPQLPGEEVEKGEWKILEGEGILETDGLYSCLGISVYDPDGKKALLVHQLPVTYLDHVVEIIQANFKDMSRLRVWLGGAAIAEEPLTKANRLTREEIEREIAELGIHGSVVSTLWLEGTETSIHYAINVGTGDEFVELHTEDDYFEAYGYPDEEY